RDHDPWAYRTAFAKRWIIAARRPPLRRRRRAPAAGTRQRAGTPPPAARPRPRTPARYGWRAPGSRRWRRAGGSRPGPRCRPDLRDHDPWAYRTAFAKRWIIAARRPPLRRRRRAPAAGTRQRAGTPPPAARPRPRTPARYGWRAPGSRRWRRAGGSRPGPRCRPNQSPPRPAGAPPRAAARRRSPPVRPARTRAGSRTAAAARCVPAARPGAGARQAGVRWRCRTAASPGRPRAAPAGPVPGAGPPARPAHRGCARPDGKAARRAGVRPGWRSPAPARRRCWDSRSPPPRSRAGAGAVPAATATTASSRGRAPAAPARGARSRPAASGRDLLLPLPRPGRDPGVRLERARQRRLAGVADLRGDHLQRPPAAQRLLCQAHAPALQVLPRGQPHRFAEGLGEHAARHAGHRGQFLQGPFPRRRLVHRHQSMAQARVRQAGQQPAAHLALLHQVPQQLDHHHLEQAVDHGLAAAALVERLLEQQVQHRTRARQRLQRQAHEGRQRRHQRIAGAALEAQVGAGHVGAALGIAGKAVRQRPRVQQQARLADLHGAAAMADVQRTAPDQVQLAHAVKGVEGVDAAQRAGVEDLCAYREALQQDGESVAHLVLPVNFSGLYAADRSSRGSTLLPAVPPPSPEEERTIMNAITRPIAAGLLALAVHAALPAQAATPATVPAPQATVEGSHVVTADGVRLYYKDWGPKDGPVVAFSHGWPLSSDSWEAQMLFLADHGFRVVAHDRRGHGRSSQPWDGNDMDHYADDLAAVIEALDLRDVTLVGFSTGGGEVARYIGRHGTSRVKKVALVGAVTPF